MSDHRNGDGERELLEQLQPERLQEVETTLQRINDALVNRTNVNIAHEAGRVFFILKDYTKAAKQLLSLPGPEHTEMMRQLKRLVAEAIKNRFDILEKSLQSPIGVIPSRCFNETAELLDIAYGLKLDTQILEEGSAKLKEFEPELIKYDLRSILDLIRTFYVQGGRRGTYVESPDIKVEEFEETLKKVTPKIGASETLQLKGELIAAIREGYVNAVKWYFGGDPKRSDFNRYHFVVLNGQGNEKAGAQKLVEWCNTWLEKALEKGVPKQEVNELKTRVEAWRHEVERTNKV